MNTTPGSLRPEPEVRALAHMLALRAELAQRRGGLATRAEEIWRDLPKTFKVFALRLVRLDPLRECMPLRTFDPGERIQLREAADRLADMANDLRKAATS